MTNQDTTQAIIDRMYMPAEASELTPSERWVRVKFGGTYIADSKRVLLFRESGRLPVYFFPREDVRVDMLDPMSHTTNHPKRGRTIYWVVKTGDAEAKSAAYTYADDPELKDHVAFIWRKMDAWYEEDEEVFVHPRDPFKRVDVMPSSRHVRVEIDGVTVADTKRPVLLFETGLPTRYYLPAEDVNMALLTATDSHTRCPYKGLASYWSVTIGDKTYKDIVWGYPDPIPEAPKIKDLLCFYNEKVDIFVDGVLQERPISPWSKRDPNEALRQGQREV